MEKDQKFLQIPYGESNFERIRTENFLYVDKTHFIRQLESISRSIHLRPRRFGKSLFVNMLEAYYDVASRDRFDELFGGLYIHASPTVAKNSYYILHFDFSGIATKDVETVMEGFLAKVKSGVELFISKYNLDIEIGNQSSPSVILNTLLSGFDKLNLENKIYILIDEYDHFTNAVLNNGLADFTTLVTRGGTVRSFYEVLKEKCGRGIVERFFMTGVMSVSLDSMTSGFNIATNITTDEKFADMMGFTTDEVKGVLATTLQNSNQEGVDLTESEQEEVYDILKQNYNGYSFSEESDVKVFNSTLIMYYLQKYIEKKKHPADLIDPNLNQSGTTIRNLVELANAKMNYEVVEEIVREKRISGRLSNFIDVDKRFDKNDFITVLFNIGFLTIKEAGMLTKFEMPNKVIESVYYEYMAELAAIRYNYKIDVTKQEAAILEMGEKGKIDMITSHVSNFLEHLSGRNAINFDEKYIKMVYLQFLFPTTQYVVYDEFPAKQGYTDLVILKAPVSYAEYEILIELKYVKKGKIDKTMQAHVEQKFSDGIAQVAEYMQDRRLAGRPNLKKFVVVFAGFEIARLEEIE